MRLLAVMTVALLAGACAGELDDPERFSDCSAADVEALFAQRCAGDCHAGSDPEAGLDLVTPGVAQRLVDRPSQTQFCDGSVLIMSDAQDPAEHLLLDKLSESPTCGARMPFGTEALSDSERACIRRWVEQVASEALSQ